MEAARSRRYDVQSFQSLEMPAVVAEQREIVAQRGCANEDVHVAYEISHGSQAASLTGEYLANVLVQVDYFNVREKVSQGQHLGLRISRIECSLIKFGNGHDAQSQAVRAEFLYTPDYSLSLMHIVDAPIAVNQILQEVTLPEIPLSRLCGRHISCA